MKDNEVFILSAVRTPIGSFKGKLSKITSVELGGIVIKEALKLAKIESNIVDHIYMGELIQAGSRQNPARQASLYGGCLYTSDATTINKACSSSLKAVIFAAQDIMLQTCKVVVAGGMESMSNAPFLFPRKEPTYGGMKLEDSIISDALTCPFTNSHMGKLTDEFAKEFSITRLEQDEYAIMSYERALKAIKAGKFNSELVSIHIQDKDNERIINEDEEPNKFYPEKISKLKPCFVENGTITAANSSKLNDGASAIVLCGSEECCRLGLKPLAKIISFADSACKPEFFAMSPVFAIKNALERGSIDIKDVSLFEINEAFSAAALYCIKALEIDPSIVNIDGGAVSLGHPVGASGARILTHLIHVLEPGKIGVAAICNGGGGSTAIVVSRL